MGIASLGVEKSNANSCGGTPEGRYKLRRLDVDVRIILKLIIKKYNGRVWTGLIRLRVGMMAGSCGHGKLPAGSIKCRKFLD
jgi:hypothetical protein